MMPFALVGTLIGVALGRRFTVVALIPAMTFALMIGGVAAVGGGAFGTTMIGLASFLICLQIGYLGGATIRFSTFGSLTQRPAETGPIERSFPTIRVDRR
jgi:hypothetical protein